MTRSRVMLLAFAGVLVCATVLAAIDVLTGGEWTDVVLRSLGILASSESPTAAP